jgi:hypothetical protein
MNRQKRKRKRADFKVGDLVTWKNPAMADLMGQEFGTKALVKEVIHRTNDKLGMGSVVIVLWLDGRDAMKPMKFPSYHLTHFTNA